MRSSFLLLLAALGATSAAAAPPAAFERYGNVYYRAVDGTVRQLTHGGNYGEPSLSPDERTVAFIREDSKSNVEGESGRTSLWVADGVSGTIRKLLSPNPRDEAERNLESFGNPIFSLDGGYVYVEAEAWATSHAIHQVSVATGKKHFVVGGSLHGILRNGPYRGYLVVNEHRYHPAPEFGSYDPDFIIRPDGKEILRVPGTEMNDGHDRLFDWLRIKGWRL